MTKPLVAKHSTKTGTNTWHLSVWPMVKLSHLGMQTLAKIWLCLLCSLLMRLQAEWFKNVQNLAVDFVNFTLSTKCVDFPQAFMSSRLKLQLHQRSTAVMNQHGAYGMSCIPTMVYVTVDTHTTKYYVGNQIIAILTISCDAKLQMMHNE